MSTRIVCILMCAYGLTACGMMVPSSSGGSSADHAVNAASPHAPVEPTPTPSPVNANTSTPVASPNTVATQPNTTTAPPADPNALPLQSFMTSYTKRVYAHGTFLIAGHSAISDLAMQRAQYMVEHMLTPQQCYDLRHLGSALVIVGVNEELTQLPGFTFLGSETTTYGTNWNDTDGVGATSSFPYTAIMERHLLHTAADTYKSENILVHEFSHHVMDVWVTNMRPDWLKQISTAYNAAVKAGSYVANSYAISNDFEYWAEGAQVFFNATHRTDATGGMVHASQASMDAGLYTVMKQIYTQPWDCITDLGTVCVAQ